MNPEIIETRNPRPFRLRARFERIVRLAYWMILAAIPAYLLDSVCIWLFDEGQRQSLPFAWVLLLVFIIPAALITLVIAIVEIALFLALLMTLVGRDVLIRPQIRFGRAPRGSVKNVN